MYWLTYNLNFFPAVHGGTTRELLLTYDPINVFSSAEPVSWPSPMSFGTSFDENMVEKKMKNSGALFVSRRSIFAARPTVIFRSQFFQFCF